MRKGQAERDGGARRTLETRTGAERLIQGEIDSTEMHRKRASGRDKTGWEEEGGKECEMAISHAEKKCNAHVKRGKFFREPVHPGKVFAWKLRLMFPLFSSQSVVRTGVVFAHFKTVQSLNSLGI